VRRDVCERNGEPAHLSLEQTPPAHKASHGDDDDDDGMRGQLCWITPVHLCPEHASENMQIAILLFKPI
jgi:hypothetical protein